MVGDVTDEAALGAAMAAADPHVVVHMAAVAGIDTVIKSPTTTMRVNLMGTANALEAARRLKRLERFVDFSTSEVFGSNAFRAQESGLASIGAVGEARWIYAVSKLTGEHMAHAYHAELGLPCVSVRPFNIYGPRQVGEGAVHHFILRALRGETLSVHNEGAQIRSWCYIDDVIDALVCLLVDERAIGHAFNIGNPRSTVTIYNLAREIIRLSSSGSRLEFIKWTKADVELRVPATGKAQELLGWRAKVDLEEGLLRTILWYRQKLQAG